MVLVVRHARTISKPAGPDPSKVQAADWNADHTVSGTGIVPVGTVIDFVGVSIPTGWLECAGQQLSAGAYPELFAALVKSAVVTITQPANPCVISWPSHGLRQGDMVGFQTSSGGVLPPGITTADLQVYYILTAGFAGSSFQISATVQGTPIATTTPPAQSGVHTGVHAPFGVSTGLTTFALPDYRGFVLAGVTNMSGNSGGDVAGIRPKGSKYGSEKVTLATPELPAHSHTVGALATVAAGSGASVVGSGAAGNTGLTGSGTAHLNMQPTHFTRKLIFAGV